MALDYRQEYQRYKRYYTSLGPVMQNPVVQAYFSLILSVVTVIVFLVFAIRPTVSTIATLLREIQDKRVMAEKLDAKINSLSLLQAQYQSIEPDLPLVFAAIPTNPDLSTTVTEVEKVATASGVQLDTIGASQIDYFAPPKAAMGPGIAVPVSIGVTGAFDNVKNFLSQLVVMPRIYAVTKVSIERAQKVDNSPTLIPNPLLPVKLQIQAYFLP